MNWYKNWHQIKQHKLIQVTVLVVYLLSIIFGVFNYPQTAEAAWNYSKTWTIKSDFEAGTTLTNVALSGDDDENDTNNNDGVTLSSQTEKRQTIAAGNGFSVAIKTDGTLWSTGYNSDGALGLGDFYYRNVWTQAPIENVVSVSASYHTLALKQDGSVWSAGRNDQRQLGDGTASYRSSFVQAKKTDGGTPAVITDFTNVKKVFAATIHSLAITNDNKLFVCGHNAFGQLGFGSTDLANRSYWTEVKTLAGLTNFEVLDIGGGERSSMVLVKNLDNGKNELYGAGDNLYGDLGIGNNTPQRAWILSPLDDVIDLEGAWWHNSVIVKNDIDNYVVYSTGAGGSGRAGYGDGVNRNVWTQTPIDNVRELSAGVATTYAFKYDGTIWGTGGNGYGQLNLGDMTNRVLWTQTNYSDVTEFSVSVGENVLLLKRNGDLMFIGPNYSDALGNGENHYRNVPTQTNFSGPSDLGAEYYGSLAIKNGTLWSSGSNWDSRLGLGDGFHRDRFSSTGINNVAKISGGEASLLVLKNDGKLWGMGLNYYSQLGVGNATYSFSSLQQARTDASTFLTDVADISAGRFHSLALKSDGTVWATGYNYYCQLGITGCTLYGTTNQSYWTQVASGASKVYAGYGFSAVLKSDGTLITVGENTSGQLGIGNSTNQSLWQTSTTGVLDAWVGTHNIFIRKTDGIYATGFNGHGQFGNNSTSNVTTWTKLTALNGLNIQKISAGYGHAYILKTDGSLLTAGHNYFGQLGQGDYVREITWQSVAISGVSDLASGYYHTFFKKNDGTIWGVGNDQYGQLGLGVFPFKNSLTLSLTGVKQPSPFISSGSIVGLKIDAGAVVNWTDVLWSADVPISTVFKIRSRGSASEAGLSTAEWSAWRASSGDQLATGNSQWLEVEVVMESADGAFSPLLKSLTINYYSDIQSPTNPIIVQGWEDETKATLLNNGGWSNSESIYAEWSGAADMGGSEVKGYWVYFGNDPTADPMVAGHFQTDSSYEGIIDPDNSGKTFFLGISTEDNAGNRFTNATDPYYKVFEYKFDKTKPNIETANVAVSPVGWSVTNNFTFTWQDVDDPLANGDSSGVRGYQYRRKNGGDSWSVESIEKSVSNIEAYQNGQNILELKAIDNAGNASTVKEISYYFNADAPTAPKNLRVTPQSSTDNAFKFEWDAPDSANGGVKSYYYSVNATPSRYNTVSVTNNSTGADPIAAATQQSFNTFYVVAMDNSDNINWSSYASIQFECNTPAPGTPTSPEIFDTSNRDLQKYSIALSWTEPEETGAGFSGYTIERSLDSINFAQIGTSAGTSYIDAGLQSQPYYYRLKAKDNSGNISAPSTVISLTPTGKYTSAPSITVEAEVETKVSTASIRWVTDRDASSFVEIGETVGYGLTQGQFDSVSDHHVDIAGLKADAVYHYRVKFVDEDGNIGYSNDDTLTTQPAPRVIGVEISEIRLSTAFISWRTTAPAESSIKFGKNSNYSSIIQNVSGGFTTAHAVMLTDLDHSSVYHLAILIKDIDGNEVLSDDYSFETQKYPVVSMVRMEPVAGASTATMSFSWETNVPTSSIVRYLPAGGKMDEVLNSKLKTEHSVKVSGLLDNTFYNVTVEGHDQFGNLAKSENQKFKTNYDTRPPKVSGVSSEAEIAGFGVEAKGQLAVSWETDEPGTSQVEYGIGSSGAYTNKTQEDATLSTSHVVIISDLKASSPYHFRPISKDDSGNEGFSAEYSALIPQASRSVFDAIFGALNKVLGWLFEDL